MKTLTQDELNAVIDNHELWRKSDYSKGARAVLTGCDLSGTTIIARDLSGAFLDSSRLDGVNLRRTILDGARLNNVSLRKCNLYRVNLNRAKLHNTVVAGAVAEYTVFTAIDLNGFKNINEMEHRAPSSIGYDTIELTRLTLEKQSNQGAYNRIKSFLRQCGVIEPYIPFLEYPTNPLKQKYLSAFISYSSADKAFSDKLYSSLQNEGVRCWYAPVELEVGDKFEFRIDRAIRDYERLILICSRTSLNSKWVQKEIARILRKEDRSLKSNNTGTGYLLPVILDKHLYEWEHPYQDDVLQRLHCDFSKTRDNKDYEEELAKLIKALRIKSGLRGEAHR